MMDLPPPRERNPRSNARFVKPATGMAGGRGLDCRNAAGGLLRSEVGGLFQDPRAGARREGAGVPGERIVQPGLLECPASRVQRVQHPSGSR